MKKIIIAGCFLMLSDLFSSGFATQDGSGRIVSILQESDFVRIGFEANDLMNPDGGLIGQTYFNIDEPGANFKLSLFMTAMTTGAPVKIYISGLKRTINGKEFEHCKMILMTK